MHVHAFMHSRTFLLFFQISSSALIKFSSYTGGVTTLSPLFRSSLLTSPAMAEDMPCSVMYEHPATCSFPPNWVIQRYVVVQISSPLYNVYTKVNLVSSLSVIILLAASVPTTRSSFSQSNLLNATLELTSASSISTVCLPVAEGMKGPAMSSG
jgi:hypothetical protein